MGAILATGLVVLGTHLATALTDRTSPNSADRAASVSFGLPTSLNQQATVTASPAGSFTLSARLSRAIGRVSEAMAVVDATFADRETRSLALVVAPDGVLLAPASAVAGAASILLTVGHRGPYVGGVTAVAGGPDEGGTGRAGATPGTALLDGMGGVIAIVAGSTGGSVVAVPAWLAIPAAKEMRVSGKITHGWLDIRGTTRLSPTGTPDGVLVDSVVHKGAAALAGIRRGDVIVAVQQHRTRTIQALMGRLYLDSAGRPVEVTILRGKRSMHMSVRLLASARA